MKEVICGIDGLYIDGARYTSEDDKLLGWSISFKEDGRDNNTVITLKINNSGQLYLFLEKEEIKGEVIYARSKSLLVGLDLKGAWEYLSSYEEGIVRGYRENKDFSERITYWVHRQYNVGVWFTPDTIPSYEELDRAFYLGRYEKKKEYSGNAFDLYTIYKDDPKSIILRRWLSYYRGELKDYTDNVVLL